MSRKTHSRAAPGLMRRVAAITLGVLGILVWDAQNPDVIRADGLSHVVMPGETLASIAQLYYGEPRRESVIVAENGLSSQGGQAIVTGLRLRIPWVSYHRVRAGETWAELASRFYGDRRRLFALVEANRGNAAVQPDEGAELLIPYPLRHVATQNDTLTRVARLYYGPGTGPIKLLRRFNRIRANRLSRGQIVLVPISELVLSEEGRRAFEKQTGRATSAGETRTLQSRISDKLPALLGHVERGQFTDAVALGNRLLGSRALTGNQVVTIQKVLGTAYVALGREDLALKSFRAALERQPDLELDSVRTSPTVMRVFMRAQKQRNRPPAKPIKKQAVR